VWRRAPDRRLPQVGRHVRTMPADLFLSLAELGEDVDSASARHALYYVTGGDDG